ncbi:MAG: hypothetical protein DWQ51_16135 [Microcystis wesenbergii TW10]|uniref:Uncharacterized protein n=1 Tax=Microcystis wesenbergii TW10 TaxID=2060474 RepID=A0A3E0LR44_9CHRO|nr:MAG: hypothetical protein DWQ51_16135 [Microcystis wesenbergii TW10]
MARVSTIAAQKSIEYPNMKFSKILGVEKVVADLPSHSEPCMRLSPHTAPSLTVPLLRIQLDFFWLTLYYLH